MRIRSLPSLALTLALASPIAFSAAVSAAVVHQAKPPTADKQSQSKADIALTQQIRAAVTKDKTLSTLAHNCKIITQQGQVTLRGNVNTAAERDTIAATAVKFAGDGHVTNELMVKAAAKSKK